MLHCFVTITGVDRRIVLEWILKKWDVKMLIGLMWHRIDPAQGSDEHGNDILDPIKGEKFNERARPVFHGANIMSQALI
jgi:hypothetical protein